MPTLTPAPDRNSAERIALILDRHLTKPTPIVVFGTSAILLDPKLAEAAQGRFTNDIDIIVPNDRELEVNSDMDFWSSLEAANVDLQKTGDYITHIMPETEVILSKNWSQQRRTIELPGARFLKIERPHVIDLILSKMGRGDDGDIRDVCALLRVHPQYVEDVEAALESANVPEVYRDVFPQARDRILGKMRELGLRRPPNFDITKPDPESKF